MPAGVHAVKARGSSWQRRPRLVVGAHAVECIALAEMLWEGRLYEYGVNAVVVVKGVY